MGRKCQDGESDILKDKGKRKREVRKEDGRLDQFAIAAQPYKTAEVTLLMKCISDICICFVFVFICNFNFTQPE